MQTTISKISKTIHMNPFLSTFYQMLMHLVDCNADFFLIQSEYVWPLNEQAEVAFFLDVGDALFEDQNWGFETARVSTGVELRFHLPIFPVPLRLIYGWPIRSVTGDRTSNFTFSIGRSF